MHRSAAIGGGVGRPLASTEHSGLARNVAGDALALVAGIERRLDDLQRLDPASAEALTDLGECLSEIRKEITALAQSADPQIDPGQAVREIIIELETEDDYRKRELLRSALVQQEDRFGIVSERLDRVDGIAEELKGRVRRQRAMVDQFTGEGAGSRNAQRLLTNMMDTLALVTTYQRELNIALDRNVP